MNQTKWQHLFGPVPSRRLGRSLGIDLVPHKVCSFNCIYCQLGPTTHLTLDRRDYVPLSEIKHELAQWQEQGGEADYLTLSGSGEPTLHSQVEELVDWIKSRFAQPLAVLTNGSLLWQTEMRQALRRVDLLIPSLDAATPEVFQQVNRPHPDLDLERIMEGIAQARWQCRGETWLEIMLVAGVNDSPEELEALREAAALIQPHRIQLNTVVRPPAERRAGAVTAECLERARERLGPKAEIIVPLDLVAGLTESQADHAERVRALLQRRPCTTRDISVALNLHPNEVAKYVAALTSDGEATTSEREGEVYYFCGGGG